MPAVPAGTLLVAEYVRRHVDDEDRPSRWLIGLHAVVAAMPLVPALAVAYLLEQHRLPWNHGTMIALAIASVMAVGIAGALASKAGLRLLYFVTLVPTLFVVAALIKIGAPVVDQTLSARTVARQLSAMESRQLPLAVLGVNRETEYGLAFYRNQAISRYELGQVPASEHLLVAPQGTKTAVVRFVPERRVVFLGNFAPQNVEFYWVAGTKGN